MTPEQKFAMNRYASEVVRQIEGTLDLSPYVQGDPAARLWFWQTMAKAVEEALARAERGERLTPGR